MQIHNVALWNIFKTALCMLIYPKIINAPKKAEENLTEDEKAERSVSDFSLLLSKNICLICPYIAV